MKKNMHLYKNFLILVFFVTFLYLIFYNRVLITSVSISSVNIWLTRVFPTLFIMFIVQDFLINYNFAYYLKFVTGKLFRKLFSLSDSATLAFLLSLISGSPSSAITVKNLYLNNNISKFEANRLLHFTYFTNPLFTYNILTFMFVDSYYVFKIMFALYISNFILAFVLPRNKVFLPSKTKNINVFFGDTLVTSIKNSLNNLTLILGSITFFMIVSSILSNYLTNDLHIAILKGFFEITNGLEFIVDINYSSNIKEIISILIISFGGMSIHTQVYSMICDTDLSYLAFLKGRIYSVILSVLIVILI